MALKDNSISILEYHIQDDRMIIDILKQSKKQIYDHYLDYVSSKSTVIEKDKQKNDSRIFGCRSHCSGSSICLIYG